MKPAPDPHEDETDLPEDAAVADPLADETLDLWNSTARRNREIFTEIFQPVPTNLVRTWSAYEVRASPRGRAVCSDGVISQNYVPKVKTGHVVHGIPLSRVKERLAQVKGSVVDAPIVSAAECHVGDGFG